MTYNSKPLVSVLWHYLPNILKFFASILLFINIISLTSFLLGSNYPEYKFEEDWVRSYNPSFGKTDAKVKVVYFFDFQCPACRNNNVVLKEVFEQYKDRVNFVYRNFILPDIHPYADISARSANAVAKQDLQKYLEFKNKLFEYQNELSPDTIRKVAQELNLDIERWNKDRNSKEVVLEVRFDLLDIKNGVLPENERKEQKASGTPTTLILKDDKVVKWFVGQTTKQQLTEAIDSALNS